MKKKFYEIVILTEVTLDCGVNYGLKKIYNLGHRSTVSSPSKPQHRGRGRERGQCLKLH
jgi:hypothetical protein